MSYDVAGVFVAHDGALEINAELRIVDGCVEITRADGSPVTFTTKVPAANPQARRFLETVVSELHKIGWHRTA